jgi:hypothetical protein
VVTWRPVVLAVLVAAAAAAALPLFQSETQKVKKSFSRLADRTSKKGEENLVTLAQKARNLGTFFAGECEFQTPYPPFSGVLTPEEVSDYAMRSRLLFSSLDVRFQDESITFPEENLAGVNVTLRVKAMLKNGESIQETYEIACTLKKIEKDWLFSRFVIVEVLKK